MNGGGSSVVVYTGASGVVMITPFVIAPAHGAWAIQSARSPMAIVIAVPSGISVKRTALFRQNRPLVGKSGLMYKYRSYPPMQAA